MVDIAAADARAMRNIRRETLGYVSQFLRVIPRVPTIQIVAEPMIEQGMPRDAALARAGALLRRLNMPDALHGLPPATFSGGEQQRVNLARGFATRHPVLLLDEPTASLDNANAEVVIVLIQEAKAAGCAILGIFHDQLVRDRVADRLFNVLPVREAA
jgi:alpha-D-ribose 1-methylphosphonate 5-triphosphate synthase subunit PhnL